MKISHFIALFLSISLLLSCGMTQNSKKKNSVTADSIALNGAKNRTTHGTVIQEGCPNNKIVACKIGDVFILKLKSYPSKGYSWALDINSQTLKTMAFKGRTVEEPDPSKMDGGPTYNIFTFAGIQVGTDTLRFRYARPFDKPEVKPLETCTFTMTIK